MNRVIFIMATMLLIKFSAPAAALLKVGTAAPAIAARDQANKPWILADALARPDVKAILIYFYPKDDTPGCTKQACGFRDRLSAFMQKDVLVVGMSCDSVASHQRFAKKFNLTFSLLADPKCKAAADYGVRVPKRDFTRRVSFLISKQGKILHVLDDRNPLLHITQMRMAINKLLR
jgi:peroxiredoxin Q/BCP